MKIYTLWVQADDDCIWLASSIDEASIDAGGGDIYFEDKKKYGTKARELIITVPDAAVTDLFKTPVVKGKLGE